MKGSSCRGSLRLVILHYSAIFPPHYTFRSSLSMTSSWLNDSWPGAFSTCAPSDAPFTKSLCCAMCSVYLVLPFALGSCVTPPGTWCSRFESTCDGRASPVPVRISVFAVSRVVLFCQQPKYSRSGFSFTLGMSPAFVAASASVVPPIWFGSPESAASPDRGTDLMCLGSAALSGTVVPFWAMSKISPPLSRPA